MALAVIDSSLVYSKIAYAAGTFPPPTFHKLRSHLWKPCNEDIRINWFTNTM